MKVYKFYEAGSTDPDDYCLILSDDYLVGDALAMLGDEDGAEYVVRVGEMSKEEFESLNEFSGF